MKTAWIAAAAIAAAPAFAQSTIYKHVDDSGRITYSNKPMKGAMVVELEPLTTIPGSPRGRLGEARAQPALDRPAEQQPQAAIVTPVKQAFAAVEPQLQRRRDEERRRILEEELASEEESLAKMRASLAEEQQNPQLVAAVRAAQQASDPTPAQLVEFRNAIDKASGRIRGLQSTVAEHEKNIEALKKELGALKP